MRRRLTLMTVIMTLVVAGLLLAKPWVTLAGIPIPFPYDPNKVNYPIIGARTVGTSVVGRTELINVLSPQTDVSNWKVLTPFDTVVSVQAFEGPIAIPVTPGVFDPNGMVRRYSVAVDPTKVDPNNSVRVFYLDFIVDAANCQPEIRRF